MSRAPRKYLDPDRTEVSDEWLEWNRERRQALQEGGTSMLGPGAYETYFPEEKELPEDGGWIRVVDVPVTNLGWEVPPLSMWFALGDPMNSGKIHGLAPYRARILTPGGNLWLWPHEYMMVPDITEWLGMEPEVMLHRLGGEPALDEDRMFYLQQRGISGHDAALMMLGEIRAPDFGWFELHPDIAALFEGVGQPLWRHIQQHPRTVDNEARV